MRALLPSFVLALLIGSPLHAQVPAETPGPAKRIWSAAMQERQEVWFRRTIDLTRPGTKARLWFSCDNECTVFVNGTEVGRSTDHQELTMVPLDKALNGKVTIAVHARNTGGPAALALWLLWEDAAGWQEMTTDETWRVSGAEVAKWNEVAFDDSTWEAAVPNFDSTFGLNLYNGKPTVVRILNHIAPLADPIARGVDDLRGAADRAAAMKALDAIERAVMDARARLWQKAPAAPGEKPR